MKDKRKGNKGRGVGWLEIGTELSSRLQLKSLEVQDNRVLMVATLEDNRSQVLKGKIEKASF